MGSAELECTKAPRCGADYQAKISGPLLDRIDIRIEVPAVTVSDINTDQSGETLLQVLERVEKVRDIQQARFEAYNQDGAALNAYADTKTLEDIAPLASDAKALLDKAMEGAGFSVRAYYRVLRVARTIADLAAAQGGEPFEKLEKSHIAEALSYRRSSL